MAVSSYIQEIIRLMLPIYDDPTEMPEISDVFQ